MFCWKTCNGIVEYCVTDCLNFTAYKQSPNKVLYYLLKNLREFDSINKIGEKILFKNWQSIKNETFYEK